MTLGKRIKLARVRLDPKIRQRDIADEFGISDKAVSSWERDETLPDLIKMPKLARKLKVPVAWLLEGPGAPPAPDDVMVRVETLGPDERALLSAMIEALHRQRGKVA